MGFTPVSICDWTRQGRSGEVIDLVERVRFEIRYLVQFEENVTNGYQNPNSLSTPRSSSTVGRVDSTTRPAPFNETQPSLSVLSAVWSAWEVVYFFRLFVNFPLLSSRSRTRIVSGCRQSTFFAHQQQLLTLNL